MNYKKTPISIDDQIALLKSRGLIINDLEKASHYLSNISYYRLRAYTYPFQDNKNPNHPFQGEVTFENVLDLYVFDRQLRLLIFDSLEKIEIALRTKIIYEFALIHGSHWYENITLYKDKTRFIRDLNKLYEEIDRSSETFIKHYKNTYTDPENPAAWMSLEVSSIGLLSKMYENLKQCTEKVNVAHNFGLMHPRVLQSWMYSFCHLRNICAHHGRIWNRRFTAIPLIPKFTKFPFLKDTNYHTNKLYAQLVNIQYVLQIINPKGNFKQKLNDLIKQCDNKRIKEMGFPKEWHKEELWNE